MSIVLGCASSATSACAAAAGWVSAVSATQYPRIDAFATVQSSGLVTIAAAEPGIVAHLTVLPGQAVLAGQEIAQLGGPQITAVQAQAEAVLSSAQATQRTDNEILLAEKTKLRQQLSTNQLVAQAQRTLEVAMSQVAIAQANVDRLRQTSTLWSPLAGVVQSVTAANGDVVAVGSPVATVQPTTGVWLKAILYTPDANSVQPGTTGFFTPANGGAPVQVVVRGTLGIAGANGGMPVALAAVEALTPGVSGTVTLNLPKRMATMVPTEALILDKGRWWVMVHDAKGEHAVEVDPGPAEGFNTVIQSGLKPGEDVVVVNAYLLYHRGIAALYQPPN